MAQAQTQTQTQTQAQAQVQAHYGDSSPTATAPPPASANDSNGQPSTTAANSTTTALSNPSSNAPPGQPAAPQHKRVYQACIPCRRRKVRCDLGSVDNPHDPPCVRCRRESKECYFSATRRKRKNGDEPGDDHLDEDVRVRGDDEYIIRNGRKRHHTAGPGSPQAPVLDKRFYSDVPLTPGGSIGRTQPLRRPGPGEHTRSNSRSSVSASRGRSATEFPADEPNTPLENYEARTVMRKEVYGPHDALDLLYKAATDKTHEGVGMHTHDPSPQSLGLQTPSLNTTRPSDGVSYAQHAATHQRPAMDTHIDPQLTKSADGRPDATPSHPGALNAWTRFRFVRAGWFTAQEAIDYVD